MTGRRGFFWPLVLIAIGLIALLANYGFISGVSLVALLGLWPLLLVLLGIDIAFARRWPIATLAADVAIIALGLWLVAFQPALVGPGFGFGFSVSDCGRDGGQPSVSVPRGTATSLRLRFGGGAGRFSVAGGAGDLVNATSTGGGLRLRPAPTSAAGATDVRLDECGAPPRTFGAGGADVDVRVARDVPSSIRIDAGAGTFTIDLRDVRLTDATLNVGAGEALLILPTPSGDVPIHLTAGASSITVQIPAGVEARVTTTGGLVSVSGNSETPGYASARDRVTVTITAGAGSVRVR